MRRTVVLRVTGIVLVICVAGGMLAATGAAEPVTQSAASLAKNVKKALRISKRADKRASNALKVARRAEKAAVAGKQGPTGSAGPQGERGAQGVAGPQGTTGLWEVFRATGSSASHVRGTASGQGWLGNGTYFVSFAPKDISGCAYTATIGSVSDGTPTPRIATVEQRTGFPTDVRVRAWDLTGTLASPPGNDNGFHVAVLCP